MNFYFVFFLCPIYIQIYFYFYLLKLIKLKKLHCIFLNVNNSWKRRAPSKTRISINNNPSLPPLLKIIMQDFHCAKLSTSHNWVNRKEWIEFESGRNGNEKWPMRRCKPVQSACWGQMSDGARGFACSSLLLRSSAPDIILLGTRVHPRSCLRSWLMRGPSYERGLK